MGLQIIGRVAWKCPECNTIYAPFIDKCECSVGNYITMACAQTDAGTCPDGSTATKFPSDTPWTYTEAGK